jgi:Fic family protein
LLTAEVLPDGAAPGRLAAEVLANIRAMERATELGAADRPLVLEDLLSVHRTLMDDSPTPQLGGVIRQTQNWIGGSNYNPCAAYVPSPPDRVGPLLDDLVAYLNDDQHRPLVQAGVAHAQFETIHPFGDGNGRTGRALIHIVLRRRGVATRFVPPISLVLATWAQEYIAGLRSFQFVGEPDHRDRSKGAEAWLRTVATATDRACRDAEQLALMVDELEAGWRRSLGRVRAESAVAELLERLPGTPVLTVATAATLIGRSEAHRRSHRLAGRGRDPSPARCRPAPLPGVRGPRGDGRLRWPGAAPGHAGRGRVNRPVRPRRAP